MKQANPYKGKLPYQSEFSHRWATWANNHMGWAKMKKTNKRIAKRRLKQDLRKEGSENSAEDAVPVVRCRNCKYYKEFRTKRNNQIMRLCYRMGKYDMEYFVNPNDFCSYGDRKEGAE